MGNIRVTKPREIPRNQYHTDFFLSLSSKPSRKATNSLILLERTVFNRNLSHYAWVYIFWIVYLYLQVFPGSLQAFLFPQNL